MGRSSPQVIPSLLRNSIRTPIIWLRPKLSKHPFFFVEENIADEICISRTCRIDVRVCIRKPFLKCKNEAFFEAQQHKHKFMQRKEEGVLIK
jgi:hypothetical protein